MPLSTEQVAEFYTRLKDLQKKQNQYTKDLQAEERSKVDEFSTKLQNLRVEFNGLRLKKDNARTQIVGSKKTYLILSTHSCI